MFIAQGATRPQAGSTRLIRLNIGPCSDGVVTLHRPFQNSSFAGRVVFSDTGAKELRIELDDGDASMMPKLTNLISTHTLVNKNKNSKLLEEHRGQGGYEEASE